MIKSSTPTLRIDRVRPSVLALIGELDIATSPALDPAIAALDAGVVRVQLDCTSLEFVDSSGISGFIRASRDLREHGRSLELVNVPGRLRKLFEICCLDAVLPVGFSEPESAASKFVDPGDAASLTG